MTHLRFLLPGLLSALCLMLGPMAHAQTALALKQRSLAHWHIGTAQYSGITPLGDGRYAVVSDKEPTDGFFIFRIAQSPLTGEVTDVALEGFKGNKQPKVDAAGISIRDCEGVVYVPAFSTLFISGEGDQQILEYDLEGQPTGRKLAVPQCFALDSIYHNYGFEALGYSAETGRFWTTTESTLRADGPAASPSHPGVRNLLRIQSFDHSLAPAGQYAYRMDRGGTEKPGSPYIYGVPCLTALPDGRLLILEREANIKGGYLGSTCRCKLFIVDPTQSAQIDASTRLDTLDPNLFMVKKLLAEWTTKVKLSSMDFANYEAMCLGLTLDDGRRTLLLLNDSQGGYSKGPFSLKDYIKVVLLGE